MFFPVLIGGLLLVRKLRRWDLVLAFLIIPFLLNIFQISKLILYSPILFFAFIMLTEPLTTPPTKKLRIIYGALIGFLFSPE